MNGCLRITSDNKQIKGNIVTDSASSAPEGGIDDTAAGLRRVIPASANARSKAFNSDSLSRAFPGVTEETTISINPYLDALLFLLFLLSLYLHLKHPVVVIRFRGICLNLAWKR